MSEDYANAALDYATGGPYLVSRCAADIEPRRIEYLWNGRIARGKHTAIAGEPGDGKSQLSVFVAVRSRAAANGPAVKVERRLVTSLS
jgi:hypothetical protein